MSEGAPFTLDNIKKFAAAWYLALDNHAPTEELTRFLLICLVFLAYPLVVERGENIVMGELKAALPKPVRTIVNLAISVSAVALCGFLAYVTAANISRNLMNATPTLVFDEVDSGIGGATADAVGTRLARLAERVQILVVTHSPQVAARGTVHLRVEKREAGRLAVTGVDRLDEDARREEVARMLSGREITDEARAAAGRLLQGER